MICINQETQCLTITNISSRYTADVTVYKDTYTELMIIYKIQNLGDENKHRLSCQTNSVKG